MVKVLLGAAIPIYDRGWETPPVEEIQRMLPQYDVQQFVARGGMGAVYRGIQRTLDRVVAIKILPLDADEAGLDYAGRFQREAKAMAKFKHPGIVTVHEAGQTAEGLLYFVMEFIAGTDLARLLAKEGRFPVDRALDITTRICEALSYAHGRGVVHRDIKPSNVMIDADGTVKVADFGLSRVGVSEGEPLTRTNLAIGTPDFLAPEALVPGGSFDSRVDIYATGVTLYQMLTGVIPRGRLEAPSRLVPDIDARVDAIVDKAMQQERSKRYATAQDMMDDIALIRDPTAKGMDPMQERIFSAYLMLSSGATPQEPEPQAPPQSAPHTFTLAHALGIALILLLAGVAAYFFLHR